MFAAENSVANY